MSIASSTAGHSSATAREPSKSSESPATRARPKARFPGPPHPRGRADGERAPRRRRPDDGAVGGPVVGGPLAHQSNALAQPASRAGAAAEGPQRVGQVADRILTGIDATGRPTARIELNLGDWAGVDVDLVAGARGIELNVFAATAAARRTIEAQLTDLANALAQRGLRAHKIAVSVRRRDNRGGSRQDGRR